MLTRLKVNGFKNLSNVDVSFGPFTCIAGVNGVGKSNLFDAITFLSAMADRPLMEAAKCIRDEHGGATDIKSLFLSYGDDFVREMSFEAEMIIPSDGYDDLGQQAEASITFLVYRLELRYRESDDVVVGERLEIEHEELTHIKLGEAHSHLRFRPSVKWRKSVVKGRRGAKFLSTSHEGSKGVVKLHQDKGGGRPRSFLAESLPRTVISSANAAESPTALLARREMQAWRLLQLEPSALRASDPFNAPIHVGADGAHMAATLHHLARTNGANGAAPAIYAQVANRLSELVGDVRDVLIDEDRQRELLTLQVKDRDQRLHAARALSDGTLRFLALVILEIDPHACGLLCFEEPENGIHPDRIESMLELLKQLTVDTTEKVGPDNPLRQVIVNTHSPAVVARVEDGDLLVAEPKQEVVHGQRCQTVAFSWLSDTWRANAWPDARPVSRGQLLSYLNPLSDAQGDNEASRPTTRSRPSRRVKDRADLQPLLPGFDPE